MIIKHLFEGGPVFMFPIAFMWLIVLFLIIKFFVNYFSNKRAIEKLKKHNSLIIYIGSFAFLFGVLGQMMGLYGALDAIEAAGDISPYLIAGGLKVSMLTVMYGFCLLLVSSVFWFIFRNLINNERSQ